MGFPFVSPEPIVPQVSATYAASFQVTPASTATDIVTIYGSATKTVQVLFMTLSATQTTASNEPIFILKRSSTNSGGTSASVTIVPYDSTDPSPTATVLTYSANPTSLGTLVGQLYSTHFFVPGIPTTAPGNTLFIPFQQFVSKPVYLRGTSEGIAINLVSQTITGGSINGSIVWIES